MIEYEKACKAAFDYYEKHGKKGINEANDLGKCWLFAGGDPEAIEDGGYSIIVDKESGKIEPFILPDKDNFVLLSKAQPVTVPPEYAYK